MGGCQNYGPLQGSPKYLVPYYTKFPKKGTIILTTTPMEIARTAAAHLHGLRPGPVGPGRSMGKAEKVTKAPMRNLRRIPSPPRTYYLGTGALKGPLGPTIWVLGGLGNRAFPDLHKDLRSCCAALCRLSATRPQAMLRTTLGPY